MPSPATLDLPQLPRAPWRGLAWLTVAVIVAHLVLLFLAPAAVGPRPSPLASKFITRTIVIAPPAAVEPAPAAQAPAAAATPPPPPKPVRPRAPVRPRPPPPAPEPEPEPSRAAPAEPGPDLTVQAEAEPAPPTDAEAANAPAPAASAAVAAVGGGTSAAAGGGHGAGDVSGPAPLRVPGSVHLSFEATGQQGASPMRGVFGELAWLQDGRQYDAQLSLTFLFRTVRSQHSNGSIGPSGIEPLRFSDKRRTEVASHFERDKGQVVFSSNAPSVPLLAGAQDRLSVIMQLGALLAGDPGRYPAGAIIAVQTVGPKDGEIWTFNVEGEEKLSLPAGEFTARKLTRNPRKPFDEKVELWLAPEQGYLPVRIRQTQSNGDFADLQLRGISSPKP